MPVFSKPQPTRLNARRTPFSYRLLPPQSSFCTTTEVRPVVVIDCRISFVRSVHSSLLVIYLRRSYGESEEWLLLRIADFDRGHPDAAHYRVCPGCHIERHGYGFDERCYTGRDGDSDTLRVR